jgi:two-component system, sensor histidine kinase and response regulator
MEQNSGTSAEQTAVSSKPVVWSELIRICGEEDVIQAVLQAFLEDAPNVFCCLDEAMQKKDCSQIALYAHRMKGSSRNIGAMDLSAAALKMEIRAKEKNMESMNEDYAELKRLYALLKTFVSNENWLDQLRNEAVETRHD